LYCTGKDEAERGQRRGGEGFEGRREKIAEGLHGEITKKGKPIERPKKSKGTSKGNPSVNRTETGLKEGRGVRQGRQGGGVYLCLPHSREAVKVNWPLWGNNGRGEG